jgi:hypothetical protein
MERELTEGVDAALMLAPERAAGDTGRQRGVVPWTILQHTLHKSSE